MQESWRLCQHNKLFKKSCSQLRNCAQGLCALCAFYQPSLLLSCCLCRPLRRRKLWRIDDIDNRFESMLLFILCFIAVARVGASCPGWPVTLSGDFTTILYIFFISWVTFLSIALSGYRFFHSWGQTFGLGATAKRYGSHATAHYFAPSECAFLLATETVFVASARYHP